MVFNKPNSLSSLEEQKRRDSLDEQSREGRGKEAGRKNTLNFDQKIANVQSWRLFFAYLLLFLFPVASAYLVIFFVLAKFLSISTVLFLSFSRPAHRQKKL